MKAKVGYVVRLQPGLWLAAPELSPGELSTTAHFREAKRHSSKRIAAIALRSARRFGAFERAEIYRNDPDESYRALESFAERVGDLKERALRGEIAAKRELVILVDEAAEGGAWRRDCAEFLNLTTRALQRWAFQVKNKSDQVEKGKAPAIS